MSSISQIMIQLVAQARFVAAYLSVSELIVASALCRSLHTAFDSEAVWQGRLEEAKATQDTSDSYSVPTGSVLTPSQLETLPPLPSLADAATLCLRTFFYPGSYNRCYFKYLLAIVHLPSTVVYHTRILITSEEKRPAVERAVEYVQYTLKYSKREQSWVLDSQGDGSSGWWAVNIDNNVEEFVGRHNNKPACRLLAVPTASSSSNSSSKRRYIDLLKCSEHVHNQCYRLLPPSLPLHAHRNDHFGRLIPPISPLPLCCSCRTVIAHCIDSARLHFSVGPYNVWGVTRINQTIYEATITQANHPYSFRVSLAHNQKAPETKEKKKHGKAGNSLNGYRVVEAIYIHDTTISAMYKPQYNVCKECHRAFSQTGMGHAPKCKKSVRKVG